jgi:hypothetical protein
LVRAELTAGLRKLYNEEVHGATSNFAKHSGDQVKEEEVSGHENHRKILAGKSEGKKPLGKFSFFLNK